MFSEIQTKFFLLGPHTNTNGHPEQKPGESRGEHDQESDRHDAQDLDQRLSETSSVKEPPFKSEEADCQSSPHPVHQVDTDRAHGIIHANPIKKQDSQHDQNSSCGSNQYRTGNADGVAGCRDRNQSRPGFR